MSPEELRVRRAAAPPAERLLWDALRGKKTGDKWRRGHPLGEDVLPLYCPARGLCVQTTPLSPEVEAAREAQGIRTMVLNGGRVLGNVEAAVGRILGQDSSPLGEGRVGVVAPFDELGEDWEDPTPLHLGRAGAHPSADPPPQGREASAQKPSSSGPSTGSTRGRATSPGPTSANLRCCSPT